jgi:phage tail-like protein
MTTTSPANTMRFDVNIDGVDIGSFTALDGLSASYDIFQYKEGGNNGYVHQLPGRLQYEHIKLTRPVDEHSKSIAAWFSALAKRSGTGRKTASITAYNDNHEVVAEWSLVDVYPTRYQGPSFSADGAKVALEILELAHNGFDH